MRKGNVFHRADYNQSKCNPFNDRVKLGAEYADLLKVLYISTLWEWRQQAYCIRKEAAWALAHDVRCVAPFSCSIPGFLVDPLSSFRGSLILPWRRKVRSYCSTSEGLGTARTKVTTMKSRGTS